MLSQLMMSFSLIGVSLPTFLIGILLILVFAVILKVLPSFGRGEVVAFRALDHRLLTLDGWKHLILPSVTLAIFQLALIMRLVRAEMLGGAAHRLHQVRARAGCPIRVVNFGHALKNTLVAGDHHHRLQLGSLIAFAIILRDRVFQWPGMGLLFIQALQFADIPVMAAYLCLIALIFVLINLVGRPAVLRRRSAPARRQGDGGHDGCIDRIDRHAPHTAPTRSPNGTANSPPSGATCTPTRSSASRRNAPSRAWPRPCAWPAS